MGWTKTAGSPPTSARSAGQAGGARSTWPLPGLATAWRSSAASTPATSRNPPPVKGCGTFAPTSATPPRPGHHAEPSAPNGLRAASGLAGVPEEQLANRRRVDAGDVLLGGGQVVVEVGV